MILNIIITSEQKEIYEVAGKIHNSLTGNNDYIESNIVLNFDNSSNPQVCNLLFDGIACRDKEYIKQKAKEAIDTFINNL